MSLITHLAWALIVGVMLPAHQETGRGPLGKTEVGGYRCMLAMYSTVRALRPQEGVDDQ